MFTGLVLRPGVWEFGPSRSCLFSVMSKVAIVLVQEDNSAGVRSHPPFQARIGRAILYSLLQNDDTVVAHCRNFSLRVAGPFLAKAETKIIDYHSLRVEHRAP
jgi:hypothetical protein